MWKKLKIEEIHFISFLLSIFYRRMWFELLSIEYKYDGFNYNRSLFLFFITDIKHYSIDKELMERRILIKFNILWLFDDYLIFSIPIKKFKL